MYRDDGSIESSNLPARDNLHAERDFSVHKAMITKIFFVDDKENISKGAVNEEVIYEAVIIGGPRSGQLLTNIRDYTNLGDESNYSEKIWRACTNPNFAREGGQDLAKQDGSVVAVQFLAGNLSYPIIVGGAMAYKINKKTGTKKADAPRLLWEYNGINVLINNKGELFVTRKGGSSQTDKGAFTPGTESESKVQLLDKKVIIEDKEGNKIEIDASSKKISITAPEQFEVSSKVMKLMAENSFSLESQTINISGQTVVIDGTQIIMGGGGPGAARLGDTAVGTGAHGVTVVSTIIQGSFVVKVG